MMYALLRSSATHSDGQEAWKMGRTLGVALKHPETVPTSCVVGVRNKFALARVCHRCFSAINKAGVPSSMLI